MTEREKLIDILNSAIADKSEDTADYVEWLADELLESGVIVPPCRLNTRVFVIPTIENSLKEITEMVVLGFSTGEPCNVANCFRVRGTSAMFNPSFEQFGESVFLTKEEALKGADK